MWKAIITWFKELSITWKVAVGAIVVIIFLCIYFSMVIAYKEHLLIKRISDEIESVKKAQADSEKETKSTISEGKTTNAKAIEKNRSIDKKLKQDEATIDNADYPNSKLDSLLTSYGN